LVHPFGPAPLPGLVHYYDLDDQLFGEVFAPAEILPEKPVQADNRAELRTLLRRASGGIVFTTLQKFAPETRGDTNPVLTDRRNVVVIADEAHRSQYGFTEALDTAGRLTSGLAKHMRDALPNATYLGFTGTPIESTDRSTRAVFGEYIDVYDLTRAVEDGATVRIFYESRLAKVSLDAEVVESLDELADEITENAEEADATHAKSKWARLEAIVGAQERLDIVAADIVEHWERRRAELFGKAMIVAMSRRIAVELYERIVALRPDWHDDDPDAGRIKVVMTGSASDPAAFQPHVHPKDVRKKLKLRAKNPDDPLEIVIVRDMWLTGFDAPAMHTMYVDKPMQGAGLMQAIARVNRTFRDKPGGLIVDYIGVATNLRQALAEYSPSDRDLAGERAASPRTIASYRDAMKLLLTWFRDAEHIPPEKLRLADIDRPRVLRFLDWLEAERSCSTATRNQRLAVIKSFCRYTAIEQPDHLDQVTQVLAIRQKKAPAPQLGHLAGDEVKMLLAEPGTAGARAIRDTVLLALAYDTAARVQELCDLDVADIRRSNPMTVAIRGKGSKIRYLPVMDPTARLVADYLQHRHPHPGLGADADPLFHGPNHTRLTRSGIAKLLARHVRAVRARDPGWAPGVPVTPHTLRRTRAMHLIQAGVNLIYIRDLLGHVDVSTTEIYARADAETKRKAIENAYEPLTPDALPDWTLDPSLIGWLDSLGR